MDCKLFQFCMFLHSVYLKLRYTININLSSLWKTVIYLTHSFLKKFYIKKYKMLSMNEKSGKANSKMAPFKMVLDEELIRYKYNTKFIFDKLKVIDCRTEATDCIQLYAANRIGDTVLHWAFQNIDLEAIDILLSHGADFTLKNNIGSTALLQFIELDHEAILVTCNPANTFVNSVVPMHVKYNIFENPVNSSGLSHFHIACAVNSVEVVKGFLQNGISIDHTVKLDSPIFPGFSPLHFAVKCNASEVVEVVLSHGANLHIKNAQEMTPLHMALERKLEIINDEYVKKAVEVANEKILELILEKESDNDMIIDDWGMTYFHAACALKDSKIAEHLLQKVENINYTVNMNSPLWSGYSALHFAALCNVDTVKLLVKNGADLYIKDANGDTPLDTCIKRFKAEDVCAVISVHPIWKNITLSDGKNKLTDLLLSMKNSEEFCKFLEKLGESSQIQDSPLWSGFSILHIVVTFIQSFSYYDYGQGDINLQILKNLCEKNSSMLCNQDVHGHTPLHLAFRLNKKPVLKLLLQVLALDANLTDCVDEDGLSFVHLASAGNTIKVLEKLEAKGVNVNAVYKGKSLLSSGIYSGSTALHFAVANGSVEAADALIKFGADVYVKDANGMTPIHLLLSKVDEVAVLYFRSNLDPRYPDLLSVPNLQDSVVPDIGLSHLHVACLQGKTKCVKMLLDNGANVNDIVTYQPNKHFGPIESSILSKYTGLSPLLVAYKNEKHDIVKLLLERGADAFVINAKGKVLLHEVFKEPLEGPEDISKYEIFLYVLEKNKNFQNAFKGKTGMTALHVACLLKDDKTIKKLIKEGADVNIQVPADSPIFQGYTPLHALLRFSVECDDVAIDELVELFLKTGADVTLKSGNAETVVHLAVKLLDDFKIQPRFDRLNRLLEAQRDFSVNPANVEGISHFHLAASICNVTVVKKFLSHGHIDVNQPIEYFSLKLAGCSPLHLAAGNKLEFCKISALLNTVDLLLARGADVHAEDNKADTPLHKCCRRGTLGVFGRLASAGADINAINIVGNTPLSSYLESKRPRAEGIKALLKSGCPLKVFNAVTEVGCLGKIVAVMSYENALKLLADLIANFKQEMGIDDSGRTMLHNIVSIKPRKISAIQYAALIDQICGTGCDVDDQDNLGRTALHMAAKQQNPKGVSGLLMAGADINLSDVNGKTAFPRDYIKKPLRDPYTGVKYLHEIGVKQELTEFEILAIHVNKLQLCGLDIHKDNVDLACIALKKMKNKWSEKFLKELDDTKNVRIESHAFTLHSFLSETGAVANYPTMSEIKRNDIDQFFSQGKLDSLRKKFPELSGILQLQYRKAKARPQLVDPAKNALTDLIGFTLPEICSNLVLLFLKNSDLKSLICSMD